MRLIIIKRIVFIELIISSLLLFYGILIFNIIADQNILSIILSVLIQTIVFGLLGKIFYDATLYSNLVKNKKAIISIVVLLLSRFKSNYLEGKDIDSIDIAEFIRELRMHFKYATYDDYTELEYIISNDLPGLISFSSLASSIDDSHLFHFHILCGNMSALLKAFEMFNKHKQHAPVCVNIRLNSYKSIIDQHIEIVIKSLEEFKKLKINDYE